MVTVIHQVGAVGEERGMTQSPDLGQDVTTNIAQCHKYIGQPPHADLKISNLLASQLLLFPQCTILSDE